MYRDELRSLMHTRGEPFDLIPERVVWDGDDLVTAGGVTSGIDLALDVVGHLRGAEVRRLGDRPTAPEASPVFNPAFDVTPALLISAIVTERGVFRAPYRFDR